jgi:outer membrane assembly lipoprotein YfgL
VCALAVALSACASGPGKPKPAELGPDPRLLGVKVAWTAPIGTVGFPLQVKAVGDELAFANSDGKVMALSAQTGAVAWQVAVGVEISAGVGFDGRFAAVATRQNDLVVVSAGQVQWQQRLPAQVLTAPLVAGERVFVLAGDRSVHAFDLASGRKLWQIQRPGEALSLSQAGLITAVGNTLVVGLSGHLVGVNPLNGQVVWDVAIANPRGTNDVERLVDLVAGAARQGSVVCVRAFQSAVGCVDAQKGVLSWRQSANGFTGVASDAQQVYAVEADGRIKTLQLSTGAPGWTSEALRYRKLTSPLVLGRSLVVGDESGNVFWLARADAQLLKRVSGDGSAIGATPVLAQDRLVTVSAKGTVVAYAPE